MPSGFTISGLDWVVLVAYLCVPLGVGLYVRKAAGTDRQTFFLAGRNLPWWWAGLSIAATTFAADTPLAVTGIIAERGVSGNWMWWSWIGVHAGAAVYFATRWSRSGVVTDAELLEIRYSGRLAEGLRLFRASLYGLVLNALILGWVLKAMVKIVSPFFHWERWAPGLVDAVGRVTPEAFLGTPSEALTILALLALVAMYSSAGGLKGVVVTDLVQVGASFVGAGALAWSCWQAAGGRAGLREGLAQHYDSVPERLDLLPDVFHGWPADLELGVVMFGLYLLVQSYANLPADGGGYLMQRLNSTRSPKDARAAASLFIVLQYVLRTTPWMVVGVCALVLIPVGQEATALSGMAASVEGDREMAYPVLMGALLSPGWLGLVLTSLLAAFMSTVDTHLNWGSSYVVTDIYLRFRPDASDADQVKVARRTVLGFAVVAVVVSAQIESVAVAWKWLAVVGAAFGVPTVLRWLWWRVNAAAEIGALVCGIGAALGLALFSDVPYEARLVYTAGASVVGLFAGIALGPPTERAVLEAFQQRVRPAGIWLRPSPSAWLMIVRFASVVGGTVLMMGVMHTWVFDGFHLALLAGVAVGAGAMYFGTRGELDDVART